MELFSYFFDIIFFYLKSPRPTATAHQTRVPDGKKKRNKLPLWNGAKIFINVRFQFGNVIHLRKNLRREIIPKDSGRSNERSRETFNSTLAEDNCILVCLRGLSGSWGLLRGGGMQLCSSTEHLPK